MRVGLGDSLPYGVKAMDHATKCFAGGNSAIPDQHGSLFIAPLAGALDLYTGPCPGRHHRHLARAAEKTTPAV